jgi:hypothetical protein
MHAQPSSPEPPEKKSELNKNKNKNNYKTDDICSSSSSAAQNNSSDSSIKSNKNQPFLKRKLTEAKDSLKELKESIYDDEGFID